MTYNPNIPQPTDVLANSQGDILTNFTQLNTVYSLDNVPFADAVVADRGKHKKCTYQAQGADQATSATEVVIYCKNGGGVSNIHLPYVRFQNNGALTKATGFPFSPICAGVLQYGAGLVVNPIGTSFFNVASAVRTVNNGAPIVITFGLQAPDANYVVVPQFIGNSNIFVQSQTAASFTLTGSMGNFSIINFIVWSTS